MTRHAILNHLDHQSLRVDTRHGAHLGDNIMCTLAIPSEFRNLQSDYPIFFHRDQKSGKMRPMVMFGFADENVYLEGDQWRAAYLPLMIQRGPFLIGLQDAGNEEEARKDMVLSIDLDNPRTDCTEGEPLFNDSGDHTQYVQRIIEVLQEIDDGQAAIASFTDALVEHKLLEPFNLAITLDNGDDYSLNGFHTIAQEKLNALSGDVLENFSQRGILFGIYMIIASLSNIGKIIDLKNAKLS